MVSGKRYLLVGKIINDEVVEVEEGVPVKIDDNGQKIVVLPCDDEYTLRLTATDDGEVTYTATEYNLDTGNTERVVSYFEIPVEKGDILTGTVENLDDVDTAEYPLTLNDEAKYPDVNEVAEEVEEYTVTVTQEGVGTASGGGYYVSGE